METKIKRNESFWTRRGRCSQKSSKIEVKSSSERFPPHIHCKTIHTCSEGGMNTCTKHDAASSPNYGRGQQVWFMRPIVSCICVTQAVSRRRFKGFSSFQNRKINLRVAFGILIMYLIMYIIIYLIMYLLPKVCIFHLRSRYLLQGKICRISQLRTNSNFLPLNCS